MHKLTRIVTPLLETTIGQMQHCVVYEPSSFLLIEITTTNRGASLGEYLHSLVRVTVNADPGNTKVEVVISGDIVVHQFLQQSSHKSMPSVSSLLAPHRCRLRSRFVCF